MLVCAFINADDVTLLAPRSMALKAMLNRCADFAVSHDMPKKITCLHFNDAGSQL